MAFIKKEIFPNGTILGIWRIEEKATYFLDILDITEASLEKIAKMNERRKIEWLAARHLLQQLLGENIFCYSDEFGKPILKNNSQNLSISHSSGLVTVIVSDYSIGIDIQKITPKIERIAPKFMRKVETESLDERKKLEHLHIYWGAKEALYKAYGKKELDFREHILVEPFTYLPKGEGLGTVKKADFEIDYTIYFEEIEGYFLVFAEAKIEN